MATIDTVAHLAEFEQRGAGTDAERRAGRFLVKELADAGRDVRIDTFWCRPNAAFAHAWHAALAVAGSLTSVGSPRIGGALILAALLSVLADALTGHSPGRRLTPERASQNIAAIAAPDGKAVRLTVTANYDAGRTGFAYRDEVRAATAWLRHATGNVSPGWIGWFTVAIAWLLVTALLRLEGEKGTAVGVAQLIPTVGLVLGLALLLEIAGAEYSPGAGDNASGVAVALALVRALDAVPPRHLSVDLLLQGASDGSGRGLRRHLRTVAAKPADTVVLAINASGAGHVRWWTSDGAFVPLRYFKPLREICASLAASEPNFRAQPHKGRGATPALPARAKGVPAIAIGCLDDRGIVPRSHRKTDTPEAVDQRSLDDALQFALMLVDEVDAFIARRTRTAAATPA